MSTRKARLRRRLFDQGANALAKARPSAPAGLYACPICLMGYSSSEMFTLEDVPPAAVGGKPLILTCATCNSTAGHSLDHHIKTGAYLAQVANGAQPIDARFTFAGYSVTASVTMGPDMVSIAGEPERSDPKAHAQLFSAFDSAARSGVDGHTFALTFSVKHDAWLESVAWLRVAYLYAFAGLGYNYILRPELNPIRAQIRRPSERIVPSLLKRITPQPEAEGFQFIFEPTGFRCLAIIVRDRFVVLPDFEFPSTFEQRLLAASDASWPRTFSGKRLTLPKQPMYLTDLRPPLVRLLSPG